MNPTNSLVLILISAGLMFFMAKPLWGGISLLREEKQHFISEIDKTRQLESKKNELLTKMDGISDEEKQKIEAFLPGTDGSVRLIADIADIASKHGISIESIDTHMGGNVSPQSIAEAPVEKDYDSKMVTMLFSTNYTNLSEFLIDLEKSLRMIDIRSVDVGQASSEPGLGGVYGYRVDVEVYWLKDLKYEN